MLNKETVIDIICCVVLSVIIIIECVVGFNLLKNKWSADTSAIIKSSSSYGQSIGLIETVFSWPEMEEPDINGDVVSIDVNRFRINGVVTDNGRDQQGYIYYSDLETSESNYLQYVEIVDAEKIAMVTDAVNNYFTGVADALLPLLNVTIESANVVAYQQNFVGGAIPIFYDTASEKYYMVLNCVSSYYVISCSEPFVLTDAKVSVHYADIKDDPLTEHSWSTYEAGAIDNTRQKLLNDEQSLESYTQANVGESYIDSAGNQYTQQTSVEDNSALYLTTADDDARALLVSYGNYKYNKDGSAINGSTVIDVTSAAAKASEWKLTQTQYSFTDYGITINGLSGKRNSSEFEVSGNATNTIDASRPWVLCVKFLGEDDALLGVKVIDNRSTPIPAKGASYFTVHLDSSDDIAFSDIVAIQFAVH